MRVAGGGPDHVVGVQPPVDQRAQRTRVADRGHPPDDLAGGLAHELRVGRFTRAAPARTAAFAVSTRCAPLVSTQGAPSALKTRLLAIAPTSHPSWAAAVAAVGAGSGSSLTWPVTPCSRSA